MQPNELYEHIFSTYITLRVGMAVIGFVFPFVLYFSGVYDGAGLQDSLSAYYWATGTGRNTARVFFVGLLFAVAACLYLYKGFTTKENLALNTAAIFGVCVASFPMEWKCEVDCGKFSVHGFSAVAMFLCLAYVVFFRALDTLRFLPPAPKEDGSADHSLESAFRRKYRIIGIVMGLSPIGAFLVNTFVGSHTRFILLLECLAIWAFSWFWRTKAQELKLSKATRRALRAEIEVAE